MSTKDTQRGQQAERDWPAGHPSASDYAGGKVQPKPGLFAEDWPAEHPSRAGANVPSNWRDEPQPEPPAETE